MSMDDKVGKQEQDQRTYENSAEARRVMQVSSDGTDSKVESQVRNDEIAGALNQILKELKIMNMHLSILTDNTIGKEDI